MRSAAEQIEGISPEVSEYFQQDSQRHSTSRFPTCFTQDQKRFYQMQKAANGGTPAVEQNAREDQVCMLQFFLIKPLS